MPSSVRPLAATAALTFVVALSAAAQTATPPRAAEAPGVHPTDKAANAISGGLPAMRGITPSRAELPASAFTKLDARQRGYLTREDVSQLDGFDAAFRSGDRDGDGRLTPREFEAAWGSYSGLAK
jgi:hypothetical protein